MSSKPFTAGIVLFDDAEELDWAGPFEVFRMAAAGREIEVVLLAERDGVVRCAKGLRAVSRGEPHPDPASWLFG